MRSLATLLFCLSLSANAQNWALLNPAYKYNYSNDGTDTISNQIFVTHIDTLGLDSFRYELNRIGVVCDTCPASLGGPCDGCFIWVDQPQFMQRSVIRSGSDWWLLDPDTFLVRTDVPLGASWPFTPDSSIVATVLGRAASNLWGVPDSIQTIGLSNGDSLVISRSSGVIRFPGATGSDEHVSIGVHGSDLGRLAPSLGEFFRYQPGDIVQFLHSWNSGMHQFSDAEHFHIQQRVEQPSVLTFTGTSFHRSFGPNGQDNGSWLEPKQWTLDLANNPLLWAIGAAPHQVVNLEDGFGMPESFILRMITEHGVDSAGHYVIEAHSFGYASLFRITDTLPELLAPIEFAPFYPSRYYLDDDLGLRLFSTSAGIDSDEYLTQGAVIGGDTIGTFFDEDYFHVGIEESYKFHMSLSPNPANDLLTIGGTHPGERITVHDATGRVVLYIVPNASMGTIVVGHLPVGIYLVKIDGHRPQRFIIAR